LSERLSYDTLYSQAISDPELKRTRLELEAALSNAAEARHVVFELFQDLARFSLEDYQPFSDVSEGMGKIVAFMRSAVEEDGKQFVQQDDTTYTVTTAGNGQPEVCFTTERDLSMQRQDLSLLGLDHPLLVSYMTRYRNLPPGEIGVRVQSPDRRSGALSLWHVATQGERGETRTCVLPLAVDIAGQRCPAWERQVDRLFQLPATPHRLDAPDRLLHQEIEPMLQRELIHRGIVGENRGYEARLIGWVELVQPPGERDQQPPRHRETGGEPIQPPAARDQHLPKEPDAAAPQATASGIRHVLSVREPWASLIVRGHKPIENRSWPPPRTLDLPCRIAIHASSSVPEAEAWLDFDYDVAPMVGKSAEEFRRLIRPSRVIGSVLVTGAYHPELSPTPDLTPDEAPWYEGEWGWRLSDARLYRQPIGPVSGKLNLWSPEEFADELAAAERDAVPMPFIPPLAVEEPDADDPEAEISYWDDQAETDYTAKELRILVEKGKITAAEADRIRSGGPKTSEQIEALYDAIDERDNGE